MRTREITLSEEELQNVSQRMEAQTIPVTESGCWLWDGLCRHEYGYISVKMGGKWRAMRVHRLAYVIENGALAKGLCVLHKCDVPSCVNPHHLMAGTQKENLEDAARKGRQFLDNRRKLSAEDRQNICKLKGSIKGKKLADMYNVTRATIQNVWRDGRHEQ